MTYEERVVREEDPAVVAPVYDRGSSVVCSMKIGVGFGAEVPPLPDSGEAARRPSYVVKRRTFGVKTSWAG